MFELRSALVVVIEGWEIPRRKVNVEEEEEDEVEAEIVRTLSERKLLVVLESVADGNRSNDSKEKECIGIRKDVPLSLFLFTKIIIYLEH